MKPIAVVAAMLACACAANPPPPLPPPAEITKCPDTSAPAANALPAPAPATPAAAATKAYHQAEAIESSAVTKPAATVDYISEIHRADRLARSALRALVTQDGHPTPDAIARAKRSLDGLVNALEAAPQ